jgi:uncharacterized membrane protein
MLQSIMLALHLLSAVVWVGGMFFAYMALRPVAAQRLEPPQRLTLWAGVFTRFFPWVWIAIILLLVTGYWMIFNVFAGMKGAPLYVHIMNGLGILMILIYMHVFFAPFKRLKRAVAAETWQEGAKDLAQIRFLVGINLSIGLITIAIAGGGRYFIAG